MIAKVFNQAASIIALEKGNGLSGISEETRSTCDKLYENLPEDYFLINSQDYNLGKYLLDYYLKQQLYLSGFVFDNSRSSDDIIAHLLD